MRLSFLIFTEITKLNTREMFYSQQIAKLNAFKVNRKKSHTVFHGTLILKLQQEVLTLIRLGFLIVAFSARGEGSI